MTAPQPFGEPEKLLLEIAEKRFAIEEDVNKTLQQKAPLLLATVGFVAAFLGQFLLRTTEHWDGLCAQWFAVSIAALALLILFVAAFCLLPALFGTYSVPAPPRVWHDHLKATRAALKNSKRVEDEVLHHLQHGYLDALIEATEKASSANERKTWWIEWARRLLLVGVPLAAVAVVAFLLQAIARPSTTEVQMPDEKPAAAKTQPAPAEAVPSGGDASPPQAEPSAALPHRPANQDLRKAAGADGSDTSREFFGVKRG
jgi:hypothetical protein